MPRYYCDYCDTYLTHDSPSVRKQHGQGYKHKANVRLYYQQFEEQQTQTLIDQRIKEHLGKTAVYQPVGAAYNQHLASMQGQRPPMSLLPTPSLPNAGNTQLPMNFPMFHGGIRPPVLPRPVGVPGYMSAPTMPQMMAPPGAPSYPGQPNGGTSGPPTVSGPATLPGITSTTTSSAAPSMVTPAMYHTNPAAPTSGGYDQH